MLSHLAAATRPLLVTEDPVLLDEALRVAALAGVELDVASRAAAARVSWAQAPVVVLGSDLAAACARAQLPRRPGVVLLGANLDDASVWQTAVAVGAEHVVFLPDAQAWLTELLAEAVEPPRAQTRCVGVIGARGGAGSTSLAVSLAVQAADGGSQAWLVDGDAWGGGVDLVLGGERHPGLRWSDLAHAQGRLAAGVLAESVPVLHGVRVISHGRQHVDVPGEAVNCVLSAARRGADLLVVDLPRQPSPHLPPLLAELDDVLLVVPCELRAAATAAQLVALMSGSGPQLHLVTRGPAPAGLAPAEVAGVVGLPLLCAMRHQPGLARWLEQGEPPGRQRGPLATASRQLLEHLRGEQVAA